MRPSRKQSSGCVDTQDNNVPSWLDWTQVISEYLIVSVQLINDLYRTGHHITSAAGYLSPFSVHDVA